MVKVKSTGFDRVVLNEEQGESFSVAVSRIDDIMLGGTAQKNDWNTEISPEDTKKILRKISSIVPELKEIEVIGETVGLRPARNAVRLEPEYFGDKVAVHNYGHGGSGFTLSWGCAKDVVEIVENI